MADFNKSFSYLMSWEDPTEDGKINVDAGGRTRFGWAEKYNPDLTSSGFYTLPTQQALALAKQRTLVRYWQVMCGEQIERQSLADYFLSIGFNVWLPTVVEWVQGEFGLTVDGKVGPETLKQMNLHWVQAINGIYKKAMTKYSVEPLASRNGLERRANG